MRSNDKLTIEITADVWPFQRAVAAAWGAVWQMEVKRRPIVGRIRYWWALLRNKEMRRALRRIRRETDR